MVQPYSITVGRALSSGARNASKGLALQAWTEVLTARALGADTCGVAPSTDVDLRCVVRAGRMQCD